MRDRRLQRILDVLFVFEFCILCGCFCIMMSFLVKDIYKETKEAASVNGIYETVTLNSSGKWSSYTTIWLQGSDKRYTVGSIVFDYADYEAIYNNVAPGTPVTLIVSNKDALAKNTNVYAVSFDGVPYLSVEDTVKAHEEESTVWLRFGLGCVAIGAPSAIIILFIYLKTKRALQKSV